MKSKLPINCDFGLLQRSLEDSLNEAEEVSLSAHLSNCDSCQRELEKLAGRPDEWDRVGTALKTVSLSNYAAQHLQL